jgi:glycosyltransferase involved in cell wall biosynthesis
MKFSIIMPTYNSEKYVAQAIESVLSQTCGDFELIIVDDGSADETYNICQRFAEKDARVTVIAAEHGGVSAARNRGISKIQGDYVLFIDGDDTWKPDLLSSVQGAIDEQDELLIFGMQHDWYLSDDTYQYSQEHLGDSGETVALHTDDDIDVLFSSYNLASPCNKVFRKELIDKNNLQFSEKCVYLEDLKFNFDYLVHAHNIKVLKKDLYRYRLFTDKKQILKRQFCGLFVNADELYVSAMAFMESRQLEPQNVQVIIGVLLNAYINEFLAGTYTAKQRERKAILRILNKNRNFRTLLCASSGKLFRLFRVFGKLGMFGGQIQLIKRRYQ